jgi:hypothetical protein
VTNSGSGSGGNGGWFGADGSTGSNLTLANCPSCIDTAGRGGTNLSSLTGGIDAATIFMGGAGQPGGGGHSGPGAGGGGGGGDGGQAGTAGGSGGSGGAGGGGGTGGGAIIFLADSLTIPAADTVFKASGGNASLGNSGGMGGKGGNGGLGGINCDGGGGGTGANGGNGGNGGGGGGGGAIYGALYYPCSNFGTGTVQSNGGLGAGGGNGGVGGNGGTNGGPSVNCTGTTVVIPPNGNNGQAGIAGTNGNDGGAGSGSGGTGTSVMDCSLVSPISGYQLNQTGACGDGIGYNSSPAGLQLSGGSGFYNVDAESAGTMCDGFGDIDYIYNIYVTDGNGCTATLEGRWIIADGYSIATELSQTNTTCPNIADGTFSLAMYIQGAFFCNPGWDINIQGPNGYTSTFSSDDGPSDYITLSGLAAGAYTYYGDNGGLCGGQFNGNFTIGSNNTPVTGNEYKMICNGGSFLWNSTTYSQSGTYNYTFPGGSVSGCDSIAVLHLNISQQSFTTISRYICAGYSVQIGINSYDSAGIYVDTLTSFSGCDSIVTLNLSIYHAVPSSNLYDTLVTGDTLYLSGHNYTQSGVYTDTLNSISGCDSIVTLYLLVENSATFTNLFDTICQGFSVDLDGHNYSVSGTYLDTISGTLADTVITLHLTVNQAMLTNIYDTICQGSSVIAGGHTYTQPGTYVDTLVSLFGCDSVRALHLTVLPLDSPSIYITVGHGPVAGSMQTDTFRAIYTACSNAVFSWYSNSSPLAVHDSILIQSQPISLQDTISCRIDCSPVSGECAVASYVYSNSIDPNGIKQIQGDGGIMLYPNPNNGSFILESTGYQGSTYIVYDMLGSRPLKSHFWFKSLI